MKQRHSQTASSARRATAFVCLCLLLSFAGCRKEPAAATTNSAAANANAAPVQASGETKCGVPYYPVRAGLEKLYRVTYDRDPAPPASYTETFADIKPDSFTQRYQFPKQSVDTGWNCTPEGMVALEYGKLGPSGQSTGVDVETVGRTGVTVPSAEHWREGYEWHSSYEIRTEVVGLGRPGGRASGTIEITSRILGREQVEVPAGTYDALKVESTLVMKLAIRAGQMTVPSTTTVRNMTWFAENVGMVKSFSGRGSFEGGMTELITIKQ